MNRGRIPLAELASLPSFYFPTPAWDRKRIAFYWDKTGQMELYLLDLPDGKPHGGEPHSGKPRQLSHGEVPRSLRAGFIWSRDGKTIVYAKDQGGNEQHDLYAIDTESGAVTQITNTPHAQEIPAEFGPDDQWLTMLSNRNEQMNLYKLRPDGTEVTPLTRFANPVMSGGIWSPDGEWLTFATNETSELKNQDVYIVRRDGTDLRRVLQVKIGSIDSPAKWFSDGKHIAITSDASGVNRPGVFDVETGEVRWFGEKGIEESTSGLSDDGRWLVALRNKDAIVHPVLYDVETGTAKKLDLSAGLTVGSEFVLEDRDLLISHMSATRRNELVLYDIESGKRTVIIPAEYGSIDPSLFVDPQYISYPSLDGLSISAILYKPHDIMQGEKLPAVVDVHGGPTGQFFRSFDPFSQFLANEGFVVLEPNIRGSTGYGVEFRDMNRYDWGGKDLEDVAAGAEYLKSLPFVDPERLAVFGGSYGGYMTLMQVVKKPELWKAAVSWVGISDLVRLYAKSMEHFKYYLRWHMGDPNENEDLWRERSAITYAENTRAKLLLVHG
ncbi:S9 family peptidase, partial [Candidatus Bipolaricaulota bacterium]|nr:S9 family peptidase [Candidatus Bipolaricaulota bacterium]